MEKENCNLVPEEMESVVGLFQTLACWRAEARLKELEKEISNLKSRLEYSKNTQGKNSNLVGRPCENKIEK